MPRKAHTPKADQKRSVVAFIEAVIYEAELQAELADAFLSANGIKLRPSSGPSPSNSKLENRIAGFVLGLGGALRVLGWERAGLKEEIAYDIPSAIELLRALGEYFVTDGMRGISGAAIGQAVWVRAIFRLSRVRDRGFGADIVVIINSIPPDLMEEIAAFLWQHRNLTETAGGT
jgi:hypothetical protein